MAKFEVKLLGLKNLQSSLRPVEVFFKSEAWGGIYFLAFRGHTA